MMSFVGCGPKAPTGKWSPEEKTDRQVCLIHMQFQQEELEGQVASAREAKESPSSYLLEDISKLKQRTLLFNSDVNEQSPVELRIRYKHELDECEKERRSAQPKFDPEEAARLREKALGEWDAAINDDIDSRMKELRKRAKSVKTVSDSGSRKDFYTMEDGSIVACRTTVSDSGRNMVCD